MEVNCVLELKKVRGKQWDFEGLKSFIYEDSGITLLSLDRINTGNIIVELQCKCGNAYTCQLSSYYAGQKKCPKCNRSKRDELRRKKWDEIVAFAKSKGNDILSDPEVYVNNKSKLTFTCKTCGEPFECSWSSYLSTKRDSCKSCCNKKRMRPTSEIKAELEEYGYTMISEEYLGNQKPLTIKCPKGHIYTTTFNQFQQGIRCKECKK